MKEINVKDLLKERELFLKKRFGQNFLVDSNVVKNLLQKIPLKNTEDILEIGTGLGALTVPLLEASHKVVSYEVDGGVYKLCKELFGHYSNLNLIHEDFLKSSFESQFKKDFWVVANIPYSITSSILLRLWKCRQRLQGIYLLVQKDFADRIFCPHGSKGKSFFSVLLQIYFSIEKVKDVGEQAFFPQPKIKSTYIGLWPRKDPFSNTDWDDLFFDFLKYSFGQKRKRLLKRLIKLNESLESIFMDEGLDINIRPEALSNEQWLSLFNAIKHLLPRDMNGAKHVRS